MHLPFRRPCEAVHYIILSIFLDSAEVPLGQFTDALVQRLNQGKPDGLQAGRAKLPKTRRIYFIRQQAKNCPKPTPTTSVTFNSGFVSCDFLQLCMKDICF